MDTISPLDLTDAAVNAPDIVGGLNPVNTPVIFTAAAVMVPDTVRAPEIVPDAAEMAPPDVTAPAVNVPVTDTPPALTVPEKFAVVADTFAAENCAIYPSVSLCSTPPSEIENNMLELPPEVFLMAKTASGGTPSTVPGLTTIHLWQFRF